jgi:hypothetical protein
VARFSHDSLGERFAEEPPSRRFAALAAAVVACAGTVFGLNALDDWSGDIDAGDLVEFAGDGFTIQLPEDVEHSRPTIPSPAGPLTADMYMAGEDDNGFGLMVITSPGGVVDLDGAVQGSAASSGGTIADMERITYQGHQAREFRLTMTKDGTTATSFVRGIDVDGTLYLLQHVVLEDTSTASELYTTVAESLEFD